MKINKWYEHLEDIWGSLHNDVIKFLKSKFYIAKNRCCNINNASYSRYWWRWILFNFDTKEVFIDKNYKLAFDSYKKYGSFKLQIDRINNNWNYEEWNIRFVTARENNLNKSDNKLYYVDWSVYSIPELINITWLSYQTLKYRLMSWRLDIMKKENQLLHNITYNWETKTIAERARHLWLWWSTIYNRINKWLPLEIILSNKRFKRTSKKNLSL